MEILWLVIGVLIGLVIAWWFLSSKFSRQLEEKEAELVSSRQQAEQDLEQAHSAHATTKSHLAASEENQAAAAARVASLEADLSAARGERDNLKSKHAALDGELTTARGELDKQISLNAATESQRRTIESDMQQLESRLNETGQKNTELTRLLDETQASRDAAGDADHSRISDLEGRIGEQETEIARLQAELKAAQSKAENVTPAAASFADAPSPAETTTPSYEVKSGPAVQPTGATDDLTKIKGIGRVLQGKLHQQGVTTFRQIADFTRSDIERVGAVLNFSGRIEREQWVEQARAIVGDT